MNARSLRNKFTDLEALAATEEYHVIGVAESWLDSTNRDFLAEYSLPGYSAFSCERENRPGGGVLLYVKASLHPTLVQTEVIDNVDVAIVQIKNRSRKVTLALVYRPPRVSSDTDDRLYEQITDISCHTDSVIFGDFNLPVAKWGDPLTAHRGRELYSNLLDSALYQHVNKPTRGSNVLDIILSTNETLVDNVIIGPEFSTSDHRIISFDVKVKADNVKSSSEKILDYRRADFNKLRTLLANANWDEIPTANDVNESWRYFTDVLNQAVKASVPLRSRRPAVNSKPKWWNNQIHNSLLAKKPRIS